MKFFSKTKYRKLNTRGVGHHLLLVLLVVGAFASFAAYRVFSSSAATSYSIGLRETKTSNGQTLTGCELAGRKWDASLAGNKKCTDVCLVSGAALISRDAEANRPAYCEGHIALARTAEAQNECARQHRWWIPDLGCVKRADKKNTNNDKRHCPDPNFPHYVAESGRDRCIANTIVIPTPGNPTPSTHPLPALMCELLGREAANATTCKTVCLPGGGALLTKDGKIYCQHAVATAITAERCAELHRAWVGIGCARLIGQKDTLNAKQCLSGFPYYNANSQASPAGLLDVCEKNEATARQNESKGIVGTRPDGTPVIVCLHGQVLNPDKQRCVCPRGQNIQDGKCVPVGDPNPNQPPNDDNNPNPPSDHGDTVGNYRIILYKDKDFKGDALEASARVREDGTISDLVVKVNGKKDTKISERKDLSTLPKAWNDKVSSYKLLSGRWQLCTDADYKPTCIKPYASDTDLTTAKDKKDRLDDKISSLRPAVTRDLETVEDITPACLDKDGNMVPKDPATGKCPANAPLSCPEDDGLTTLVLRNGECKAIVLSPDFIVPVDKSFLPKNDKEGELKCKLLGREYITEVKGKTLNGGQYGCSIVTCDNPQDGRPHRVTYDKKDKGQKVTDTVCISALRDAPYAVKLDADPKASKQKCDDRARVWINQVRLCAQVPNRKDKNQTIVDAEQCASKKRDTYYIFKETSKTDECFSPTYFERAKAVVKATGGSLSAALNQGPRAYCMVVKNKNYHWDKNKGKNGACVIDRFKCWKYDHLIPVTQKCPEKPDDSCPYDSGWQAPGTNCVKDYCDVYDCSGNNNGGNNGGGNNGGNNTPDCPNGGHWDPVQEVCKGGHFPDDDNNGNGGRNTYYATYDEARGDGLNLPAMGYYAPDTCFPGTYSAGQGFKLSKPFRINNYFGNNTLIITDGVCKK